METKYEKLVDQLEEILEKNRDAEKGYKKAAENADSPNLKAYFDNKSRERAQFNNALRTEMIASYDSIDDNSSFTGSIHRAWMDIKALFSADNDESMLEEAIRGDKAAIEEYDEVLDDATLPASIAALIRDQKLKIRTDLNKIKSLEDLA
ncbi:MULTISPECIES: PA2169 family four-helix-bundle protein [Zobellia]|uniref:ferritin-like domain-containing protein n=1 Tax=Zobellia TaxID=112040 RepID=UPI001C06F1ED|nr:MULTISPECIES: PA2169 family four-helix-bundle protein [unclassified Zobellia]MBU2973227.1 PA2169 family four-helix-bundle protein [Zobellia sp. B3R18]MDO6821304.1 PA2169 family four-helix-bundle protein [Zobellia sp. 1_MG-2023]